MTLMGQWKATTFSSQNNADDEAGNYLQKRNYINNCQQQYNETHKNFHLTYEVENRLDAENLREQSGFL